MAFTLNLFKTTKSLFPLAIRLTRVQSNYHSSISTALNSCLPSKQPYRLYPNSFYSNSLTAVDIREAFAEVKEIEPIIDDINGKYDELLKKIKKTETLITKLKSKAMDVGGPPSDLIGQHCTSIPKIVSLIELALTDMKLRMMEIKFKNIEIKFKKGEIEYQFYLSEEEVDEYEVENDGDQV